MKKHSDHEKLVRHSKAMRSNRSIVAKPTCAASTIEIKLFCDADYSTSCQFALLTKDGMIILSIEVSITPYTPDTGIRMNASAIKIRFGEVEKSVNGFFLIEASDLFQRSTAPYIDRTSSDSYVLSK